jgi:carbamoyl-phosphate synthase large subunit
VLAIDPEPDALFGVDLTYDRDGIPNPTEINIGRFFTTHLFFTELGVNMPYIFVKLACDEAPPEIPQKLNPALPGMVWIRGMDFEPVLVPMSDIESQREQLTLRRQKLHI